MFYKQNWSAEVARPRPGFKVPKTLEHFLVVRPVNTDQNLGAPLGQQTGLPIWPIINMLLRRCRTQISSLRVYYATKGK